MTRLTHSLAHFPLGHFIALGLAAVPFLLALGQRQFALGDALATINPEGHKRQALGIQFSLQFVDLFLAQEQFPRSERPVIVWPSRNILADMEVHEPNRAAANGPRD